MKNKISKIGSLFNGNLMGISWEPYGNLMGALSNANETHVKTKCRIAELQNCRTAHLHICKNGKNFARIAAMLLMLLTMSVGQIWGADVEKGTTIYFDNSLSQWNYSYTYFAIAGNDNNSTLYKFNKISNTQLYVHQRTDNTWTGYNYIHLFAAGSSWGTGGGSWDNMRTYGSNLSLSYNNYGFASNGFYGIKLASIGTKDNPSAISIDYYGNTYSSLNKTQTVVIMVSEDDGKTYSQFDGDFPATIKASKYYTMKDATSTNSSQSKNLSKSDNTFPCVYTASASVNYTSVTSAYTAKGFGLSPTGPTYTSSSTFTYSVTGENTCYVFFARKAPSGITITADAGVNKVEVGKTIAVTGVLTPAGCVDETINWSSENTSYITVSGNNKSASVTGVAPKSGVKVYAQSTSVTSKKYLSLEVFSLITFDPGEGTCATQSLEYTGSSIKLPVISTPSGKTFKGWYTAPSGGTKVGNAGASYSSQTSVTLYAQFDDNQPTYSITYNCDGATSGCPANLTEQTNLPNPLPEAPFKLGYKFLGWFTNSSKTEAAVAGAAISANTTLYAKWSDFMETSVIFDREGGNGGQGNNTIKYGANEKPVGWAAPTKDGYIFDGYWDGDNGTGTKYFNADGSPAKAWDIEDASVTLYAKWTCTTPTPGVSPVACAHEGHIYAYNDANRIVDGVRKNPLGSDIVTSPSETSISGNLPNISVPGLTAVTLTSCYSEYKSSFAHLASYIKAKTSESSIKITLAVGYTGALTIKFGAYSNNKSATVTNAANSATATSDQRSAEAEDDFTSKTIALVSGDNVLTITGSNNAYISHMDIVTVAPPTTYAVTYNDGGHGTAPDNTTASQVTLSEITGVDGWTNIGWKANVATTVDDAAVAANTLIANGKTVVLSAATTFTAQWAPAAPAQVVWKLCQNGNTPDVTLTETSTPGIFITSTTVALGRDNYTNWSITDGTKFYTNTSNNKQANTWYDLSVVNSGNIMSGISGTYYVWVDARTETKKFMFTTTNRQTHTLTWELDGGTITTAGTNAGSVEAVADLTAPVVTKTGYTFAGWSPEVPATMPDEDATYTATWTENKSSVTVTTNGVGNHGVMLSPEPNPASVGVTTTATLTAEVAKYGYTFTGWTLTGGAQLADGSELSDRIITIKGDGNGTAGTATANYAEDLTTGWYLGYQASDVDWTQDHEFEKKTGESTGYVAYYTVDLTASKTYEFKVINGSDYYGNTGTMTSGNCTNWTFYTKNYEQDMQNAQITTTVAGSYIFKVDFSGTNPKVSVTYPTSYTVTFGQGTVKGGGQNAVTATGGINNGDLVLSGTEITFTRPDAIDGYIFKGWYTNNTGEGVALGTEATYTTTITANTNVYAVYDYVSYDIHYELDGGTNYGGAPATYNIGTATIILGTPTKDGYYFEGWYTEKELTNKVTEITTGSTGNKEFWAKWTWAKNYTNGNSDALASINGSTTWTWHNAGPSENVQLTNRTTPARDNDVVLSNITGFSTEPATFNSQALEAKGEYLFRTGGVDSKAFSQLKTLKFNTTVPGTVQVMFSHTSNNDDNESKRRYLVINGDKKSVFALRTDATVTSAAYAVSRGDVTISAKVGDADTYIRIYQVVFTEDPSYNVIYQAEKTGGEVPVDETKYFVGDQATVLGHGTLVREGYKFNGWEYNETKYKAGDEFTMPAENVTMTARWKQEGWYLNYQDESKVWHNTDRFAGEPLTVTKYFATPSYNYTMEVFHVQAGQADVYYKNKDSYMTENNCTGWVLNTDGSPKGFTSTIAGNYVFTMTVNGEGKPVLSLRYPKFDCAFSIPALVNTVQPSTVSFTPDIVNFDVTGYELYYTNDGGTNWTLCEGVSANAGVYSYNNTFTTAGTYQLKVVVKNGDDQVGEPFLSETFDVVAPSINIGVSAYPRATSTVTVTPTVTGLQSDEYHYCWSLLNEAGTAEVSPAVEFARDGETNSWTFTAPAEGNYMLRLEVKPGNDCEGTTIISKEQALTILGDYIVINMVRDPETLWKLENNIYYYKGGQKNAEFPGVQMTFLGKDVDDDPWYTYTIQGYSAYNGGTLIFNDAKASGEGNMHQTGNIDMPQTDGCYYVKANLDGEWKRQWEKITECPDLTRRVVLLSGTENQYQGVTYTIKGKAVFFLGEDIKYTYSARIKDGVDVALDDHHSFIPANAANDVTYVVSIRATSEVPGEDVTSEYEIVMKKNPVQLVLKDGSTIGLNNNITLRARRTTDFPANSVFTFTVIEPGTYSQVRFSEITKTTAGQICDAATYQLKSTGKYIFNVVIRNEDGQVIGAAEYDATIAPMKAWVKHNWDGTNWTWKEMTYRNDGTYAYYDANASNGSYFRSTTANDTLCSSQPNDNDQHGATTTLNPDGVTEGTIAVYVYDVAAGTLTVRPADSELRVYRIKSVCSDGTYYSNTVNKNGQEVSFYAQKNGSLVWQSRLSTDISGDWDDVAAITTPVLEDNVYTATATTLGMTALPLTKYNGKYTIYSPVVADGAQQMTSFTPNADAANEYFNNYYVLHLENGNAVATVGNDINHNISTVLPYYELPQPTNLRYAYNNKTNVFVRNYLANSTGGTGFLTLYGENLKTANGATAISNAASAVELEDQSNWVYTYTAQGILRENGQVTGTIKALYNGMSTWILAASGLENDEDATIELLSNKISATGTYNLRLIYDYKTNRLTSGWIPSGIMNNGGTPESVTQVRDMMVQRTDDSPSSEFSIAAGTVVALDHMTTEFVITKQMWTDWTGNTVDGYKTLLFWISLPYLCKVGDVYGFDGGYSQTTGTSMEIQTYRGDLRDKGTAGATPWRALTQNAYMVANTGYVLSVRLKADDFKEIDDKSEVRFFFPSTGSVTLSSTASTKLTEYSTNASTIQRDWHVMGVPVMMSGRKMVETDQTAAPFEFAYKWSWAGGDRWYEPIKLKEGENYFDFLPGHAYMVQGHGNLTWSYEKAGTGSALNAPQRALALTGKDFRIELMQGEEQLDKTYVLYRSNGKREYEVGRDLEKIENAGRTMLYSELNQKLASICLADTDYVQIPLTIVAAENGTYTIHNAYLQEGVRPVLYDQEMGITTLLDQDDYTVELAAGTYRNRFYLGVQNVVSNPTGLDDTESSAAHQAIKLEQNGIIYILRDGHIYDVTGRVVR